MKFTGERYVPWEPNAQASYEHYHRYSLALAFASGKTALDLASGEGYGAALLSQVAESVIGVDVNADSIVHAQSRYGNDSLCFLQGDIHNVPLQDKLFDLITCFETIEHIHEQEKALDELARLLKDDGILLISTPNRALFTKADKPWPWHVKEFYENEFRTFLESHFKDVIFLGQKTLNGSAIWPLEETNSKVNNIFIRRMDEGTAFVDMHEQIPMFFLAIASNKNLRETRQALTNNYLVDVSLGLIEEKNGLIEKLKSDITTLDDMVRDKEEDLIHLTNHINKLEHKPLLHISAFRSLTGNIAVCTIASKNYLAQVRVFAKSMAQSNPEVPVYVLIVDRVEGEFDPTQEPYHVILLEELGNIPNPEQMYFKFTPLELNTAVKPFFLEYLIQKFQLDSVCYFDPDIYVFSNLSKIWSLLEKWSLVLTPHILSPYPEDDLHPTEIEINMAGVFNLGFIGISNTPSTLQFLQWWQKRLYEYCYLKPSQGMHVDQNWVNFAPAMHDRVFILRDPAYNIAYWNLHERASGLRFENNQLTINHRPAVFFHYSGFNSTTPELISAHQNRFHMKKYPNVRAVYQFYMRQLEAEGQARIAQWTYAFGRFDNGVKIPDAARAMYARADRRQKIKFGNPFSVDTENSFYSWVNQPVDHLILPDMPVLTRLHMELYNSRPDLQVAFPEPLGANRRQVIRWLETHAVDDFKIDPYFVTGKYNTKQSRAKSRFGRMQFIIRRLMLNIHPRLKQLVAHLFPPHSLWFQKLRMFNKKYVEKNIEVIYPAKAPRVSEKKQLPYGVNVAGYLQGEFGVAEIARSSLKSLAAANVPYVLNNIKAQAYRDNDPTFADFSLNNPYRVNLMHVNADQTKAFANEKGPAYFQNRYNIACWFWELSTFPKQWQTSFDYLQEVWVASSFCQESIASSAPIPVVKINFPILVDDDQVRPDRRRYGLSEDPFIFGFVFDFHSLAERKNPHGLIKAFEMAFGDRKDVLLVIKSINGEYTPQKMQQLRDVAQSCMINHQFIDGYFPRQDAISLVSTFDSFVSLHRSEGLGIGMAQAMYLKKPVIATGYSGNMEFMNHNNSFLVRYEMTELQENYGPYEKGNVWAEPDLEHAATLMRQVYEDRILALKVAERASIDISTRMVPAVTGRAMKARLQLIS